MGSIRRLVVRNHQTGTARRLINELELCKQQPQRGGPTNAQKLPNTTEVQARLAMIYGARY